MAEKPAKSKDALRQAAALAATKLDMRVVDAAQSVACGVVTQQRSTTPIVPSMPGAAAEVILVTEPVEALRRRADRLSEEAAAAAAVAEEVAAALRQLHELPDTSELARRLNEARTEYDAIVAQARKLGGDEPLPPEYSTGARRLDLLNRIIQHTEGTTRSRAARMQLRAGAEATLSRLSTVRATSASSETSATSILAAVKEVRSSLGNDEILRSISDGSHAMCQLLRLFDAARQRALPDRELFEGTATAFGMRVQADVLYRQVILTEVLEESRAPIDEQAGTDPDVASAENACANSAPDAAASQEWPASPALPEHLMPPPKGTSDEPVEDAPVDSNCDLIAPPLSREPAGTLGASAVPEVATQIDESRVTASSELSGEAGAALATTASSLEQPSPETETLLRERTQTNNPAAPAIAAAPTETIGPHRTAAAGDLPKSVESGAGDTEKFNASGEAAGATRQTSQGLVGESSFEEFGSFAQRYWIAPDGKSMPVPWTTEEFEQKVLAAIPPTLRACLLIESYVYTRAAEEIGADPPVDSKDLEAAGRVLAEPRASAVGADPARFSGICEAVELGGLSPTPGWKLRVALQALRPAASDYFDQEQVQRILSSVRYSEPRLTALVSELLRRVGRDADPVTLVRSELKQSSRLTLKEAEAQLHAVRREFQTFLKQHWRGGSRAARTHCRQAWHEFMVAIEAQVHRLFPPEAGGDASWDTSRVGAWIDGVTELHREIADRHDAAFGDRRRMDKTAADIAEIARRVNDAMTEVARLKAGRREQTNAQLRMHLDELRPLQPLAAPGEELVRELLLAVLLDSDPRVRRPQPLSFNLRDLCLRPQLLELIDDLDIENATEPPDAQAALVTRLRDFPRAAAVLMAPLAGKEPQLGQRPLQMLREALERDRRPDLLMRLAGIEGIAGVNLVQACRRLNEMWTDELNLAASRLERQWAHLDALASGRAPKLRLRSEEALRLASRGEGDLKNPLLVHAWICSLEEAAARAVEEEAAALRVAVQQLSDEERKSELLRLVDGGQYLHVIRLLNRLDPPVQGPRIRETVWRSKAEDVWPDPDRALAHVGKADRELAEQWRRRRTVQTDKALMRRFTAYTLPPQQAPEETELRTRMRTISSLCDYLDEQKLNPSYLPQLYKFDRLIITMAPQAADERESVRLAVSETAAREQDLIVVLAPGLSDEGRTQFLQDFHNRQLRAAVIDDLDLCRLINPGGRAINRTLGLLEIVLEQQDWDRLNPFEVPDGQHVKPEMFTGRQAAAEDVARTSRYSRLFSGRKLGKSALLRFVQHRYDRSRLPSGLTLRVLFVPVVGCLEDQIVERIAERMTKDLDCHISRASAESNGHDPGTRLEALVRDYLVSHPDRSLLVVLDEADQFVEEQLELAGRGENGRLSWRMRDLEALERDSHNLSRIRFVFSGYRVTNTKLGVWGNWKDVLTLGALEPDEAERLVAGPLGRLGVDCTEQAAAIAFRCGYQPAVILRFGEQLLRHLQAKHGKLRRREVRVGADDVAAVANALPVREEIAHIVSMNFQGDRRTGIIFSTAILEFDQTAPSRPLNDAADRVLARLVSLVGDADWLDAPGSAKSAVEQALNNCVDRRLLERVPASPDAYRLSFPHHFPLLLRPDQEDLVAAEIGELIRATAERARPERSLIAEGVLESLSSLATTTLGPELGIRAAIVAADWPEALHHPVGGLIVRAGLDASCIVDASVATPEHVRKGRLCLRGMSADAAARIIQDRPSDAPAMLLTGGIDLLRWAIQASVLGQPVEVSGLRRIREANLRWWLSRVRGLEFQDIGAISKVLQLTSGIPTLVAIIDRELMRSSPDGGFDVDRSMFESVCNRFETEMVSAAHRLRSGAEVNRLIPRELDVLRMVQAASPVCNSDNDLPELLTDSWPALAAELGHSNSPDPLTSSDYAAVQLLQELGLLPMRDGIDPLQRLAAIRAPDAAKRLIDELVAAS